MGIQLIKQVQLECNNHVNISLCDPASDPEYAARVRFNHDSTGEAEIFVSRGDLRAFAENIIKLLNERPIV